MIHDDLNIYMFFFFDVLMMVAIKYDMISRFLIFFGNMAGI